MLTLPPSVRIYVAAHPVDARKIFDGLSALVQSEFGLDVMSGHLFFFLNRRGHVVELLFWDRHGFCLVKKRLESGTFCLVRKADEGDFYVEINSPELALMLEGIELDGANPRRRAARAGF